LAKKIACNLIPIPILVVFFFMNTYSFPSDHGAVWGYVFDENNLPMKGVTVRVSGNDYCFAKPFTSDDSGYFCILGIPSGNHTIIFDAPGYKQCIERNIRMKPSQTVYCEGFLFPNNHKNASTSSPILLDYTQNVYQTFISGSQISDLPSAHNVWSLVENQDLSATSSRIDVGGLWGTIPAYLSGRGGTSWTQTSFSLNGMDVTDPYSQGMPLFYPDFFALHATQSINASAPPNVPSPGGHFNIITKQAESRFHGGVSLFFIDKILQSSNITPELEEEGIFESHKFNRSIDGNFHLSGPIIPEKLSFATSFTDTHISRDIADYEGDDKSSVISGLFGLKYNFEQSSIDFLWTGQIVSHPTYGAYRRVPEVATSNRRDHYNIFQTIWRKNIQNRHFLKAGLSFAQGHISSDFQPESGSQYGEEIFRKILSGTAASAAKSTRNLWTLQIQGNSFLSTKRKIQHRFQYGLQLQYASASSSEKIKDDLHLHFFGKNPLEVIKFNTPIDHKEAGLHFNLYFQDSITLPDFLSVYFGLHLSGSRGWIPGSSASLETNRISWWNISPRLGFMVPLTRSKKSAIHISAGRYYFTLPLEYLTYGNPGSLGGMAYDWNDRNGDGWYQEGESEKLLRRIGPRFAEIDPDLKRPYTNELAISLETVFGSSWHFSFGLFTRETKNLIAAVNTGVPFSAYNPVTFKDSGDDRMLGNPDDLTFTVYDQQKTTLGQDSFLLTNTEDRDRITNYHGADITLVKYFGERFTFFLSLTATNAKGATNPGNTHRENDEGVVGDLYANPNTLINARGRVAFDRAYTGRIGVSYLAPFDIRLGCIIKYYDGQPFARKLIVPDLTQGPFYIQANPRGLSRYEYNRTVDVRLEKIFHLPKGKLRVILDGFNILNRALATEENEWTSPEYPLRYATEIQSPRVFRLGLAYEF
jgi:hypothetical protein